MINVLIDGNFFTRSIFEALHSSEKISQNSLVDIWTKHALDLLTPLRGHVKRVIFTVDDRSWRKDFTEDVNYKKSRKDKSKKQSAAEKEMYSSFFEKYNEFQDRLRELSIEVIRVSGAEADDVIFYWAKRLNENNEDVLIVSGDSDLRQLLSYEDGEGWSIIFESNVNKRVLAAPGWIEGWLESEDSFMDMSLSTFKAAISTFIKNKNGDLVEINPLHSVLDKIIRGDSSDDVPGLHYKKTKTGKSRGIGKKSVEKIIDYLEERYDLTRDFIVSEEGTKQICKAIVGIAKIEKSFSEIESKFCRNRSLVMLHESSFPGGILNAIRQSYEDLYDNEFSGVSKIKEQADLAKRSTKEDKSVNEKIKTEYKPENDFKI